VLAALQGNIKEAGFYFFPGLDRSPNLTKEQKAAVKKDWSEKYLAGPRGILVYHPDGETSMSPRQCCCSSVQRSSRRSSPRSSWATGSRTDLLYRARRVAWLLLGLLPFFAVNFPYWNWYGFPANFTLAQLADKLITYLVAGLVLAANWKPATRTNPTETTQAFSAAARLSNRRV